MDTIRFSFNGGEVNTVNRSSAILITELEQEFPSLFSQENLAYHLEDYNELAGDPYHSICLGYTANDITQLLDLELLEDKLKEFNDELQEHFDYKDGSWDPHIKVFIKQFGKREVCLWVRFFYY